MEHEYMVNNGTIFESGRTDRSIKLLSLLNAARNVCFALFLAIAGKLLGRQEQSTNKSESIAIKNEQGLKAKRIPIEYDKTYDPFDDGSAMDSMGTAFHKPLLKDERNARRRAILEAFRAGTISLEEAELRLNNLN